MMTHAEISFKRKNYQDGFGFSCMKAAYLFGITGRMDYGPGTGVNIQAEGEQGMVAEFIKWIKANANDADNILYQPSFNCSGAFKEFDIYLHAV